jgi:hypothetical protein
MMKLEAAAALAPLPAMAVFGPESMYQCTMKAMIVVRASRASAV